MHIQRFGVNVEVALRRDGRWLVIQRGFHLANAPGLLGFPGGRAEIEPVGPGVLESTGRREVLEEVGLDLEAVPLRYAGSEFFVGDDKISYIGVTFAAELGAEAEPRITAPDEVERLLWLTTAELETHPSCPQWTAAGAGIAENALGGA